MEIAGRMSEWRQVANDVKSLGSEMKSLGSDVLHFGKDLASATGHTLEDAFVKTGGVVAGCALSVPMGLAGLAHAVTGADNSGWARVFGGAEGIGLSGAAVITTIGIAAAFAPTPVGLVVGAFAGLLLARHAVSNYPENPAVKQAMQELDQRVDCRIASGSVPLSGVATGLEFGYEKGSAFMEKAIRGGIDGWLGLGSLGVGEGLIGGMSGQSTEAGPVVPDAFQASTQGDSRPQADPPAMVWTTPAIAAAESQGCAYPPPTLETLACHRDRLIQELLNSTTTKLAPNAHVEVKGMLTDLDISPTQCFKGAASAMPVDVSVTYGPDGAVEHFRAEQRYPFSEAWKTGDPIPPRESDITPHPWVLTYDRLPSNSVDGQPSAATARYGINWGSVCAARINMDSDGHELSTEVKGDWTDIEM